MDTDKLAYEIFAVDPGSFFEILGQPRSEAKHYVFHAVDLKSVERRVDGYFQPKSKGRPLYFSEILFYKKENAYANVFAKLFLKLEQVPTHPWRVAMLFESKSLEPADVSVYRPLLASDWVYRIYLDQVQETSQSGLGLRILKLASAPESDTVERTVELAERVKRDVKSASHRNKLLDLIEFIAISKLLHMTRKEIRAMLNLGDHKKSQYYKETREEICREVIQRMANQGIAADVIARTVQMDLPVVEKILKKKAKK